MKIDVIRPALLPATSAFLAREHKLLIDGKWVEASSGGTIAVEDPATEEVIATVQAGDRQDVEEAVKAARRAFETGPWPKMKPADRAKILWRLADLLERHSEQLAELESIDVGKPLRKARTDDIPDAIAVFRYFAGAPTRLTGDTIPVSSPGDYHAYTIKEPIGVVGQIIPWNYPITMASWKVAPALAAGCTIVLKPSELTPLTALRLAELSLEAGVPAGVFNLVTGYGATAGAALAEHRDVDKIAFTGSTTIGKRIVQSSVGNLKRVSLELGGKSPAIIFPDADLDNAIAGTADAIFYNQGQTCTASSRLFAHKAVYDKVVEGVAEAAASLKLGHGLDLKTTLGPLVSRKQRERVQGYLDSGREQGAEVVTGGGIAGERGYFVQPTVLAQTNRNMRVVQEEIFGPVVCVQSYDDDELDAVAKFANDTIYGLRASIWTRDLRTAHIMARKIKSGGIGINTHNYAEPAWPFGGYKQSGWGRELGKDALDLYTEVKAVAAKLS
ncbi:aldehyde dehydrogenase family protein [Mesorhizobium sp.]|uniref:aldehyde dehydrogenase family protein n=1 Tax=Mesorhizobium sp. TaxID=1871066 RepID=UPI000FE4304A|nr:aldehyde dehydrogenase family protein [Mesorhizobium sp.]RWH72456.1 MAG: aldehyde dehydrogenase family protein [Mesorhizobium sp.]RWL34660.1 MAG: aldehyde dehydrogenase family protein [Mesorhizobium sp.]RWL36073.1 MAG: aldehyde dehydrogenase family protein [Mesorhizobium sp.]RWL41484.1 MAG: aldehyde dehydrogenase family protein [Mesorhizobium sp.]RWL50642.1 MAG: aldehyde dehydrogenase family protein [Mesorhizobium sp.]